MNEKEIRAKIQEDIVIIKSAGIIRIESEFLLGVLEPFLEEDLGEYRSFLHIDYSLPAVCQEIFKKHPGLKQRDYQDSKEIEEANRGKNLGRLFEVLEEMRVNPYLFVRNPQEMDVQQCRGLVSLMIYKNNAGMLPRTNIVIPGGDWWNRKDFNKERLPDGSLGGDLSYARWEMFPEADLRLQKVGRVSEEQADRISTAQDYKLNVFGSHCSGKTYLLYRINCNINSPFDETPIFTIYAKYAGDNSTEFLDAMKKRELMQGRVPIIDGADRLDRKTLNTILENNPKVVCSSLNRIDGFDDYIDMGCM